jgi:hypothetical protein
MNPAGSPTGRTPLPNNIALERYLSKAVGRDMALKTIVYCLRLATVYTNPNDKERSDMLQTLILNIIDSRMLGNQWKYMGTFRGTVQSFLNIGATEILPWMFATLTLFFRTFEQLFGDLGYMQKNWISSWSRVRISWHYKFWKSMSLTCSAIVELIKIMKYRQQIRVMRRNIHTPAATPIDGSAPQLPTLSIETAESEMAMSQMFLFRNLCDMVVYYVWIESYKPPKTLECLAGMCSGAIGVWLVWDSAKYPSHKERA